MYTIQASKPHHPELFLAPRCQRGREVLDCSRAGSSANFSPRPFATGHRPHLRDPALPARAAVSCPVAWTLRPGFPNTHRRLTAWKGVAVCRRVQGWGGSGGVMGVAWNAVSEGPASLGDRGKVESVGELLADGDSTGLSNGAIWDEAVGNLGDPSRALCLTPSVGSLSSICAAVPQAYCGLGGGSCRRPGEAGSSLTER